MFRSITAEDILYCDIYMHDIRTAFGVDILTVKIVITDRHGTLIQEGCSALMGQAGVDGQSGFTQTGPD